MIFTDKKDVSKELANGMKIILATYTEIPRTEYKVTQYQLLADPYVIGFCFGTVLAAISTKLKDKSYLRKTEKRGLFIFETLSQVGFTKDSIEKWAQLITNNGTGPKDEGIFSKGFEHGEVVWCATFQIQLNTELGIKLLKEVKNQSKSLVKSGICPTERDAAHIVATMLTIDAYIKNTYIDGKENEEPPNLDNKNTKNQSIKNDSAKNLHRNLFFIFNIKFDDILNIGKEKEILEALTEIEILKLSPLISTFCFVDLIHTWDQIIDHTKYLDNFKIEDAITHYEKVQKIIEMDKIEEDKIVFLSDDYMDKKPFEKIRQKIIDLKEAIIIEHDNEKINDLRDIITLHNSVLHNASNLIKNHDNARLQRIDWGSRLEKSLKIFQENIRESRKKHGGDFMKIIRLLVSDNNILDDLSINEIKDKCRDSGTYARNYGDILEFSLER